MIARDIHPDTRRIADLLATLSVGDVVTYDDLTEAIGRNIQSVRHIFYSAARLAEREAGVVLACEIGRGYRRLAPVEMPMVGQTARARGRGIHRRGGRSIAAGIRGANGIPPDIFRKILAEQSVLGVLAEMGQDRRLPKIPEGETRPLSVAATTKVFLEAIGAKG